MSLVRTLKFEVDFRKGSPPVAALERACAEMTVGLNRTAAAIHQTALGALPVPINAKKDKTYSRANLGYMAVTGSWQPYGYPLVPLTDGLMALNIAQLTAAYVTAKLGDAEHKKVMRGEKSLVTFKRAPLMLAKDFVKWADDESWALELRYFRDLPAVVVAPIEKLRRTGSGAFIETWKRLRSGEYKMLSVQLTKDPDKGKWFASVAWSGEVAKPEGRLAAGLDMGIVISACIGYIDKETGEPERRCDKVQIPETCVRAWNAVERARRERLNSNRKEFGRREGKGRGRKQRVVQYLGDKRANLVRTAAQETAAGVVRILLARGATVLYVEDLVGMASNKMTATAKQEMTNAERAEARKAFLSANMYTLQTCIIHAAEAAGIEVHKVKAKWTSCICSACGELYSSSRDGFGRVKQSWFKCRCGYQGNADHNAALNIAARGLEIEKKPLTRPSTPMQVLLGL